MQLTLALAAGADVDEVEIDDLARNLRARLLELDVTDVQRVPGGDLPPEAKAAEALTIGALLVTLAPAVLQSAVSLVESWAANRRGAKVELTIDGDTIVLDNPGSAQQQQLVELFLSKHAQGS